MSVIQSESHQSVNSVNSMANSTAPSSGGGGQTISTRARKVSKSKNDLDQIPIATPLLGETQGQISNTKNIQS